MVETEAERLLLERGEKLHEKIPVIPRGWKLIPEGELVLPDDRFLSYDNAWEPRTSAKTSAPRPGETYLYFGAVGQRNRRLSIRKVKSSCKPQLPED